MHPLVIAVLVLAVGIAAFVFWQRRRSDELRNRYGSEYDRAVADMGRRRAESELASREKRVERFHIRPLTPDERGRYVAKWREIQARFVDDPRAAVTQGDVLVDEVMRARGYPIADFDQRIADLSVNHARVVDNYRAARGISVRHRQGEASTEDLRQAMIYYRALFEDLLSAEESREVHTERIVERHIDREDGVRAAEERAARQAPRDQELRP